ncbi:unnamed protein product [Lactuca saligna]|uniref:Uncharacterized protein n=1 Tax=Lactuca saligna TaxID=75948 RepID=A0AA35ZW17_LACSI|nr:unnamed protein product [Lactuca saligna]
MVESLDSDEDDDNGNLDNKEDNEDEDEYNDDAGDEEDNDDDSELCNRKSVDEEEDPNKDEEQSPASMGKYFQKMNSPLRLTNVERDVATMKILMALDDDDDDMVVDDTPPNSIGMNPPSPLPSSINIPLPYNPPPRTPPPPPNSPPEPDVTKKGENNKEDP